jgi:hypothetical protein
MSLRMHNGEDQALVAEMERAITIKDLHCKAVVQQGSEAYFDVAINTQNPLGSGSSGTVFETAGEAVEAVVGFVGRLVRSGELRRLG